MKDLGGGEKLGKVFCICVIDRLHGNCSSFVPEKAFRIAGNMQLLVFSLFKVNFLEV